jgi:rhodanese-related sulfurtransferase
MMPTMLEKMYKVPSIAVEELASLLGQDGVALIDTNPGWAYRRAHIPGARHLPDYHGFAASELPRDKSTTLVFYCSHSLCGKAPQATIRAQKMGYGRVLVLYEGIAAWEAAGQPFEEGRAGDG